MYGGISALDMEFSHILNNADEWHNCAWVYVRSHSSSAQLSLILRYCRRPSVPPAANDEVFDEYGRDGLLRRVLNSGLLVREGYSTPEAGVELSLAAVFLF